jgi:hypothetical protein
VIGFLAYVAVWLVVLVADGRRGKPREVPCDDEPVIAGFAHAEPVSLSAVEQR